MNEQYSIANEILRVVNMTANRITPTLNTITLRTDHMEEASVVELNNSVLKYEYYI